MPKYIMGIMTSNPDKTINTPFAIKSMKSQRDGNM